jgi:predicted amidophosphoribosyltransferase
MKPEEAIRILKRYKKSIESDFTPLICPDCESKIIMGQRYCENCGQKIDWGIEE